jgi:hypothetical protein
MTDMVRMEKIQMNCKIMIKNIVWSMIIARYKSSHKLTKEMVITIKKIHKEWTPWMQVIEHCYLIWIEMTLALQYLKKWMIKKQQWETNQSGINKMKLYIHHSRDRLLANCQHLLIIIKIYIEN